jgi:uncharacterized heparinase superfamily protein
MYHSLVLEDLLDLENILNTYSHPARGSWVPTIISMRRWLRAMVHPDGHIAFFNDVALGIAGTLCDLESYAARLGLRLHQSTAGKALHLKESGYIRLERESVVALLDVAPVGPDYLPAHAHADTLSFELSLFDQRVLVNSGTSLYQIGVERDRQRSTAAHNSVVIDGENSSEIWAGFRVGRRARVFDVLLDDSSVTTVQAAHDGYARLHGRPIHRRKWFLDERSLTIVDSVEGGGRHLVEVVYHAHPDITVSRREPLEYLLDHAAWSGPTSLRIEGPVECEFSSCTYHPRFGTSISNRRARAVYRGLLPVEIRTTLRW